MEEREKSVCVWRRGGESECVCVCEREKECVCVCVCCRFLLLWSGVLIMYPTTLCVCVFSNVCVRMCVCVCVLRWICQEDGGVATKLQNFLNVPSVTPIPPKPPPSP